MAVLEYRIKREEDRLKREIEERELKEAEELLAKTGKGKKLKEGEKLDKNAIMQVSITRLLRCPVQLVSMLSITSKVAAGIGHFDQMPLTSILLSAQACCKDVTLVAGPAACTAHSVLALAEARCLVELLCSTRMCSLYTLLVAKFVLSLGRSLSTSRMRFTRWKKNNKGIGTNHWPFSPFLFCHLTCYTNLS